MQSKHTPGPWFVQRAPHHGHYVRTAHRAIAEVRCDDNPIEPDGMDNARLIAAAPDMLEVLQTIENDAGQVPGWLWDRIQAAIAKATGTDR